MQLNRKPCKEGKVLLLAKDSWERLAERWFAVGVRHIFYAFVWRQGTAFEFDKATPAHRS
jgi:hypothetical protein